MGKVRVNTECLISQLAKSLLIFNIYFHSHVHIAPFCVSLCQGMLTLRTQRGVNLLLPVSPLHLLPRLRSLCCGRFHLLHILRICVFSFFPCVEYKLLKGAGVLFFWISLERVYLAYKWVVQTRLAVYRDRVDA